MPEEITLLFDDVMVRHDPGLLHPERPDRIAVIRASLLGDPLPRTSWRSPRAASRDEILRVHEEPYLAYVETLRGERCSLDPDTAVSPDSVDAAFLAAGAAVEAAEALARGETGSVFGFVRPPGHHAEAGRAMGFCLFNNIAVAAAHAVDALDFDRVLIVDWDVHHGNGTQDAFYRWREVLVFNTHQSPLFPGTGRVDEVGAGNGVGYTVNVPLPPGAGDGDLLAAYRDLLVPVAESFRPELVLVSAGFDAHRDDPLAGLQATEEGFAAMCGIVRDIAGRFAGGRVALLLEGGYHLGALVASVRACIEVLGGAEPPEVNAPPSPAGLGVLREARRVHSRFWKL